MVRCPWWPAGWLTASIVRLLYITQTGQMLLAFALAWQVLLVILQRNALGLRQPGAPGVGLMTSSRRKSCSTPSR